MKKIIFKPCVIVLSGTPLSGKTTLAEKLVGISNLSLIDVDIIRNEIDESRKKDGQIRMLEPQLEKAVMIKAYAEMCRQAEKNVNKGIPMIITGTFSTAEFKQPLEQLATVLERKDIPLKVFLLTISDDEALERIEKRKKAAVFPILILLRNINGQREFFKRLNLLW